MECVEIVPNYLFYIKDRFRQRVYRGDSTFYYSNNVYEFIVIAGNKIIEELIANNFLNDKIENIQISYFIDK